MPSKSPVQLNWLARYVPLQPHLDEHARRSLLEVGSGHRGVGVLVDTPFVGVEMRFTQPPESPMVGVEYDGEALPFVDGAFDTVLCVDTFEHVPPAQRARFLDELLRVAASRVLIAFPAGNEGKEADAALAAVFAGTAQGSPGWLHEHEEHGMPDVAAVEAQLRAKPEWLWESLPTVGSLQCLALTLLDVLPGVAPWARRLIDSQPTELARWIGQGTFGESFRKAYRLERREAVRPRVDFSTPLTLTQAMRCPACRKDGLALSQGPLHCPACGSDFAVDARGAFALKAKPEVTTFYLEPNWERGGAWEKAVVGFLRAFRPDAPCRLWLQVDPRTLSLEQAAAALEPLHAPFGAEGFAELTLSCDLSEVPSEAARISLPPSTDPALSTWTAEQFRTRAPGAVR